MAVAGGIARLWRSEFPAPMNVMLALILNIRQDELGVPHDLLIEVIGPGNETIGQVDGAFHYPPEAGENLHLNEELVAPAPIDLRPVGLPQPGTYEIRITIDRHRFRDSDIMVIVGPRPEELPEAPDFVPDDIGG